YAAKWIAMRLSVKMSMEWSGRIFISRQNSGSRRIVNFDLFKSILEKYMFQIISIDEMNLNDQIALFKNSNIICAVHGAGLTNMIFSKKTKIVEILANIDSENDFQWYDFYYTLSQVLGFQYSCFIADGVPIESSRKMR